MEEIKLYRIYSEGKEKNPEKEWKYYKGIFFTLFSFNSCHMYSTGFWWPTELKVPYSLWRWISSSSWNPSQEEQGSNRPSLPGRWMPHCQLKLSHPEVLKGHQVCTLFSTTSLFIAKIIIIIYCELCQSLIRVRLCVTPCTVAHRAPLSMGFSRQEYWSGLACPSPGDLPDPGIKPGSPARQADSLPSESLFITYNLESTKIFLKENRGRV